MCLPLRKHHATLHLKKNNLVKLYAQSSELRDVGNNQEQLAQAATRMLKFEAKMTCIGTATM